MTKINSKNKGSSFERDISNKLSKRFEGYTNLEKSFRRNPDSGAYFGKSNASRVATHDISTATFGDIITPVGFRFCLECKAYKEIPSLKSILDQQNATLDKWIAQVTQDATQANLKPCLIIKYDRIAIQVLTPDNTNSPCSYKGWSFQKFDEWILNNDEFFFERN